MEQDSLNNLIFGGDISWKQYINLQEQIKSLIMLEPLAAEFGDYKILKTPSLEVAKLGNIVLKHYTGVCALIAQQTNFHVLYIEEEDEDLINKSMANSSDGVEVFYYWLFVPESAGQYIEDRCLSAILGQVNDINWEFNRCYGYILKAFDNSLSDYNNTNYQEINAKDRVYKSINVENLPSNKAVKDILYSAGLYTFYKGDDENARDFC